jgi:hypothetical protein
MTTSEQQGSEYGVLTLANHILDALGQDIVIDDDVYLYK